MLLFSFVSSVSGPYTCFHRFVFEIDKPVSAANALVTVASAIKAMSFGTAST